MPTDGQCVSRVKQIKNPTTLIGLAVHQKYRCFEVQKTRFWNSGFRFGSYVTLRFHNYNGGDGKIIFPLRLAIVK